MYLFVCLFVCLFNRSLRAETHLGPDGTGLEQNAQARLKSLHKHAGQLVYGNVKRETDLFFFFFFFCWWCCHGVQKTLITGTICSHGYGFDIYALITAFRK